jgi:hypothetical protein
MIEMAACCWSEYFFFCAKRVGEGRVDGTRGESIMRLGRLWACPFYRYTQHNVMVLLQRQGSWAGVAFLSFLFLSVMG